MSRQFVFNLNSITIDIDSRGFWSTKFIDGPNIMQLNS